MKEDNKTYEIYYDKEADFLEVFIGEPSECYADEIEEGIFIRKDNKTDEVKSIGILSFRKRVQVLKKILGQFKIDLPLNITLN